MKRTDMERIARELKRSEKKSDVIERKQSVGGKKPIGSYISELAALFHHDETKIYNSGEDIRILELLENMKEELPESDWDTVIKKAVRKTKVSMKDQAITDLRNLAGIEAT